MTKEQVEHLRRCAVAIGNDGAYSSRVVVVLCDELLEAWKELEAAMKLMHVEEGARAVC